MSRKSNGERIRTFSALIVIGTMIYYLADIHANVKDNTEELRLRRDHVYSIPTLNERISRIPQIEADIANIKDSLARIEAEMGIPRSSKSRSRLGGRLPGLLTKPEY